MHIEIEKPQDKIIDVILGHSDNYWQQSYFLIERDRNDSR